MDREAQTGGDDRSARPYPSGKSGKSARPKPVAYVPIDEDELNMPAIPAKKKHKGLRITGVAAIMVVVAAGCAYGGVSYYYSDKFFDGTTINGIDCSRKTPYEVEQLIAENVENYTIQVSSRNLEPQVISGDQIDYKYVSDGEVLKLLKQQKPYEWIRGFFEEKSYTISENVTYSKELLQNQVLQLNCAKKENQVAPENAYVAFADTQFEIIPETEGSELNVKQAYQILDEAVAGKQDSIDFAGNSDAYVAAAVTSEDPGLQATLNACNNFTKASITYTFGEETVTLDGSTIKDWLQFDEKGQYVQDDASFQQHIKDYIAQLAAQYDTVGTDRAFNTTSGRTVYVYGSAYGWKIDQDAEAAQLTQEIQSGTQTTRDPVYSMTANSRGYNDLGNTYIEVDMSDQHMYYYQNGAIIFESDIVSGNMSYSDRQTPPGIFTLYYKKSPDVLKGEIGPDGKPEYETPVQYWMPFNVGIGFHDASWQPYFGGDRYLTGGSHGCINMPPGNAAVLYDIIQYGVPIICFY
ncbi:MAG: peptidoglycan binding domain-containing protein [Eubacteriales bacterium]|nr:peptidoglycan binding domain-containing protein [Eubacteriales bacterium]